MLDIMFLSYLYMNSLDDMIPVTKRTQTMRRDLFSCSDPYKVKVKVRVKAKTQRKSKSRSKSKTYKCYPMDHTLAKKQMLRFLERPRTWDCVSGPKQKLGNCWFNVMFMSFFISDYGFKYTRPLRRLMIRGERLYNSEANLQTTKKKGQRRPRIHPLLRLSFLKLNACIQASIDCTDKSYPLLKDTNFIIGDIADVIQNKSYSVYRVDEEDGGNPIHYYRVILSYLLNIDFSETNNRHFYHAYSLSMFDAVRNNSKLLSSNIFAFEYIFTTPETNNVKVLSFENNGHTYVLDSIIISNDEHYISFLTVNGKEYAFDGESYSRVVPMKWKHRIRDDTHFNLTGEPLRENTFSFAEGSQVLFYCRK